MSAIWRGLELDQPYTTRMPPARLFGPLDFALFVEPGLQLAKTILPSASRGAQQRFNDIRAAAARYSVSLIANDIRVVRRLQATSRCTVGSNAS